MKQLITQAAETDSLLVFFSHNIGPAATIGRIDMPVEWLEELLAHARKHKVRIVGFDELNALKKKPDGCARSRRYRSTGRKAEKIR